jgi:outer membrane exchange protein TraA
MLLRRPAPALTSLFASLAIAALASTASAAPVTIPTATANALQGQGQGLCVASAISTAPAIDFPQMAGVFNSGINNFLETNKANRVEYVQQTIFDLSNNQDTGAVKVSWGDFTNSMMPLCQIGGCNLYKNDTTTSFASRFRGFLNVPSNVAGKPIHIGFYADDAVSLTFFDKSGNGYPVITQPPVLGAPTWRVTETVTFAETGLYPLEILYAQIVDSAALEMTFFTGTFTDFQQSAFMIPITSLNTAGFTLYPVTDFFQTLSGQPSYTDPTKCQQCDRMFVGHYGNNGCDASYYCNEAALCAPCNTDLFCGPTCSPCGNMTPFCVNANAQFQCGECRTNLDCKQGFSCDPTTHVCNQCNTDGDCNQGMECVAHVCQWCAEQNKCAGNSCNCCPVGANGKPMLCTTLPGESTSAPDGGAASSPAPECVECTQENDVRCAGVGVCDVLTGLCVPALAKNESAKCCGPDCLECPADNPLCLPGPYGTACAACRNDMECPTTNFCIEGQCSPCTHDRHCGARCETCSGDTPFCNSAQIVAQAACVRCTVDSECTGGKCDPATHTCVVAGGGSPPKPLDCAMTCAPATPYCDGTACVECYADTQCPCNGTCDMSSHTCSSSCKTNGDCLGDQHCHYAPNGVSKECSPGPLPDNAACGSTLANICSGNSIGARGTDPTPASGILALSVLGLWLRRKRRSDLGAEP